MSLGPIPIQVVPGSGLAEEGDVIEGRRRFVEDGGGAIALAEGEGRAVIEEE